MQSCTHQLHKQKTDMFSGDKHRSSKLSLIENQQANIGLYDSKSIEEEIAKQSLNQSEQRHMKY